MLLTLTIISSARPRRVSAKAWILYRSRAYMKMTIRKYTTSKKGNIVLQRVTIQHNIIILLPSVLYFSIILAAHCLRHLRLRRHLTLPSHSLIAPPPHAPPPIILRCNVRPKHDI